MIKEMSVSGMGGIQQADLRFQGNFIVITGESGSGKSSLVRAFEFISGRRAQVLSIYGGMDSTLVRALFLDNESRDTAKLESAPSFLVERSLAKSGKGRCKIQNTPVTVAELADSLQRQIGIQSQFAQLSLLDPQKQMELVDSCGEDSIKQLKEELSETFSVVLEMEKELVTLKNRRKQIQVLYENAEDVITLVKRNEITEDTERAMEADLQLLENSIAKREKIERFLRKLSGEGGGYGIIDQLEALCHDISSIAHVEKIGDWQQLANESLNGLQLLHDTASALNSKLNNLDYTADRERIEERLGAIRKAKRSTGSLTVEHLLAYVKDAEEALTWLKGSFSLIEEKSSATESKRQTLIKLLRALREERRAAAKDLENRVQAQLKTLGMEDIVFTIQLTELQKVRATGAETVQFMISRKDQPCGPVAKNASGGELSRILVALQASIVPKNLPQVLIFDEVEAGLGGKAALLTARKLKEISEYCQIILITHEATIAAIAEQHFLVRRHGEQTSVEEVSDEQREKEIARMLAGKESPEAIEHAKALLDDLYSSEEGLVLK